VKVKRAQRETRWKAQQSAVEKLPCPIPGIGKLCYRVGGKGKSLRDSYW